MEGIAYPYPYDLDIKLISYFIFQDEILCTVDGICFIQNENNHFGLEDKIEKLAPIINDTLNKLKDINDSNKECYIKEVKKKQDYLNKLPGKFKQIKQKFIEYDDYYRKNLIEYYRKKYDDTWAFNISERKKYLSIGVDIQMILRDKFFDFLNDYYSIVDSFIGINNYILKVKRLFNIE